MKPQNPIIKRDPDLGWEVFVPPAMLTADIETISLSPEGLYILLTNGAWDLIPFTDMADLVETSYPTDDDISDIHVLGGNQALVAKLTCPVNIVAGQPETIITGQERAYRRWHANQGYKFVLQGAD